MERGCGADGVSPGSVFAGLATDSSFDEKQPLKAASNCERQASSTPGLKNARSQPTLAPETKKLRGCGTRKLCMSLDTGVFSRGSGSSRRVRLRFDTIQI